MGRELRVDGGLDDGRVAKSNKSWFEEGKHQVLMHPGRGVQMTLDGVGVTLIGRLRRSLLLGLRRCRRANNPLALVLLDRTAVLANKALELRIVEPAASHDQGSSLFRGV